MRQDSRRIPLAVIVSGRLDLPSDLPLLHEPDQQVLVATFSEGELPGPGIEYLRFKDGVVDMRASSPSCAGAACGRSCARAGPR